MPKSFIQRIHMQKRYVIRWFALFFIFSMLAGILPKITNAASSGHGLNNPVIAEGGITTWDCVWFGNYWQNDTNGDGDANKKDDKEPIKWRVLSVDGDDAFLLADKSLDVQRYDDTWEDVTWETCMMRKWLNRTFLKRAFSASERAAISNTFVESEDNPECGAEGGNNTIDKIYLLSISEVMNPAYGFPMNVEMTAAREAINTEYVACGGEINTDLMNRSRSTDIWWLRVPGSVGYRIHDVSGVDGNGGVYMGGGYSTDSNYITVRPVLHLNLNALSDTASKTNWFYAGTVTSDRGGTEIEHPFLRQIRKSSVTGLKVKVQKKGIRISWKKVSGAAGYEVSYSTSKKFTKKKSMTAKKAKLTIKNLEQNKVYYVKMRAYMIKNGKKVYGAWSKVRKKKIK